MSLADPVRQDVEHALREMGLGGEIRTSIPVGGGCINNGLRIDTETGSSFFLKWNADAPVQMFEAEAAGLAALREARAVRVPEPLAWGGGDDAPSWLLLEYITPGATRGDSDERLGRGLAALHDRDARETFGWDRDNWIGTLPQANDRSSSWGAFWHNQRIAPQLAAVRSRGHFNDSLLDRLLEVIPAALSDVSSPQLLHGDLWSGNALVALDGEPVVIDPAVYWGADSQSKCNTPACRLL